MRLHGTDALAFFLRPKKLVAEMFGFEREILLIVHPYTTPQVRILHIASQIRRPPDNSVKSFSALVEHA